MSVYSLKFVSESGREINLSYDQGVAIKSCSGLTGASTEINTSETGSGVGERVDSTRAKTLTISVSGTILKAVKETKRLMLLALAPRTSGWLTVNDAYKIKAYVSTSPKFDAYDTGSSFSFSLLAPYPYWQELEENTVLLLGLTKCFTFPWNISNDYTFSTLGSAVYVNAVNQGNVPARWKLEFYARGSVTNPYVMHQLTQKYVKLYTTMAEGDRITIDQTGNTLTVTKRTSGGVESNLISALDLLSDPEALVLQPGDNLLQANATTNRTNLNATLFYPTNWSGVIV